MAEDGAARDEFAEVLAAQLGALQEQLLAEHGRAIRVAAQRQANQSDGEVAALRQEVEELRAENTKLHSELLTLANALREDVKLLVDKMAADPELQAWADQKAIEEAHPRQEGPAASVPVESLSCEPASSTSVTREGGPAAAGAPSQGAHPQPSAPAPQESPTSDAPPREPATFGERLRAAADAAQRALQGAEEALAFSMPGVHTFNGGMGFTGTDVSPGSIARLPAHGSPYTVEAWVKPEADSGVAGILGWGDWGVSNKTQCLLLQSPKEIEDTWWVTPRLTATLENSLADGNFHHIAATWDGTTRKLFLNFKEVASVEAAPNAVTSTETLCIGQAGWDEAGVTVCPFKGSLKDLRIWRVADTADQLRARNEPSAS